MPQAICTPQRICCFTNLSKYNSSLGSSKQQLNKWMLPLGSVVTSKSQNISTAPLTGDERIGVLLLNLGGPETLEDVQPFLFNLFADPVRIVLILHLISELLG